MNKVKRFVILFLFFNIIIFISNKAIYGNNISDGEGFTLNTFEILEIPDETKVLMMGKTIYENSVLSFDDLRYLKVTYYGYDDKSHIGEIIVFKDVAEEVINIFKELYEAKYPIEKMVLPDYYDGNDENSMRDNNSSGYNDRPISETKRSYHQLGLAIDINPLYNPFIIFASNHLEPSNAREYLDREKDVKGMIKDGDKCVQIFKKYGWEWGGDWTTCKDYQHFEKVDLFDIQTYGKD